MKWLLAALLALMLAAQALAQPNPRRLVLEYYLEALEASRQGVDVSEPVRLLNQALQALREGDNASALAILSQFPAALRSAVERHEEEARRLTITAVIAVVAAAAVAYLAYRRIPALYYRFMAWYLSQYRIRRARERAKVLKSRLFSEEVAAVLAAVTVVASVFAVAQALRAGKVAEPFCALGTLGPRRKIGDYPKTVVVGDTVRLYAYVHNYLGYPAYFRVLVKLGDNSSVRGPEGFNATTVLTLEKILLHNESVTMPFSFKVEREGVRQRLILELWIYNTTNNSFTFTGRWNQIWFNATRA